MNIIRAFNRLSLNTCLTSISQKNISTNVHPLYFKVSPCLFAEPLKKKKKQDPAILRQREERKKKKLEKQIRKLEKNARQLKPIEECEIPLELIEQKDVYARQRVILSDAEVEKRILLEKKWANYKRLQHLADIQMIDRITYAQQRALDELRKESEELYQEAIQIDMCLLPFKTEGPLETPPKNTYEAPDGDYLDVSKKW